MKNLRQHDYRVDRLLKRLDIINNICIEEGENDSLNIYKITTTNFNIDSVNILLNAAERTNIIHITSNNKNVFGFVTRK